LTRAGNVGIGTTNPNHTLDVVGDMKIKTPLNTTSKLHLDDTFILEADDSWLRLNHDQLRVFEYARDYPSPGSFSFFFDNVDVYPDSDNAQSLGKRENKWSEVHAAKGYFTKGLNLSNLTTPPPGVNTVDLVIDPITGTIYRKS
jgi:hypothetical protein